MYYLKKISWPSTTQIKPKRTKPIIPLQEKNAHQTEKLHGKARVLL